MKKSSADISHEVLAADSDDASVEESRSDRTDEDSVIDWEELFKSGEQEELESAVIELDSTEEDLPKPDSINGHMAFVLPSRVLDGFYGKHSSEAPAGGFVSKRQLGELFKDIPIHRIDFSRLLCPLQTLD